LNKPDLKNKLEGLKSTVNWIEITCVSIICIELERVTAVTTQQFLTPIMGLNEPNLKNKLERLKNFSKIS
jgi:hypothetical protein